METPELFYFLAFVPVLGSLGQWLAWRLRLPSILLLLVFGVLLGVFIHPDELLGKIAGVDGDKIGPQLLFPFVSLAVAVILFEGGLTLRFAELRQNAGQVVARLSTLAVIISWLATTLAAHLIVGLDWRLATLLGAILVVTGPTVIAPLLRHIRPARRVGSIAKWEGIVVDPIGAVLAVLVFEQLIVGLETEFRFADMFLVFARTMLVGFLLGISVAMVLVQMLRRYLIPDFLHGVVFLAAALGSFALSNWMQEESGLVTVTILGIALANQRYVSVHHIVQFKEHLGIFLIACLFIVLGARLDLQEIQQIGWPGLGFLFVMIVIVRPLSVFGATWGSELSWQERTFLAFLAPRGIVAAAVVSVFSLKLLSEASHEPSIAALAAQAEQLVPLTFLLIVGTVLVYGLGAGPLARLLKLADPKPQGILFGGAEPWVLPIAKSLQDSGYQVLLVDTNYANVAQAKMAGLTADCCSILSEHVREELDLSGIGRMLAVTGNDEVNALAVGEFAHLFGRANVFQLQPWDSSSGRRSSVAHHLRGRALFQPAATHDHITLRVAQGADIKKTQLTDAFSYDNFRELYRDSQCLLFRIDSQGSLHVCSSDDTTKPTAGDTVLAMVDPPTENATAGPDHATQDEQGGITQEGE